MAMDLVTFRGTARALYEYLFGDAPQFCDSRPYEIEGVSVLCDHATGPQGEVVRVRDGEFHVYRH